MVDLGFLLITFFVFTTALSLPKALKMISPTNGKPPDLRESAALTVIPTGKGEIFYYYGDINVARRSGAFGFTSFAEYDGIGKIIRDKKASMEHFKRGFSNDLTMMIKPTRDANMQEIVSLLDETHINAVSRYCLLDAEEEELAFLNEHHFFQKAATR